MLNAFAEAALELIHITLKLRNGVLFQECIVHIAGRWEIQSGSGKLSKREVLENNIDIFRIVTNVCSELNNSILQVNHHLFVVSVRQELPLDDEADALADFEYGMDPIRNPKFYRTLKQSVDEQIEEDGDDASVTLTSLRNHLEFIIKSNLSLDKTGYAPGEGDYSHYFLSAKIKDEDMPWDATEIDW